MRAVWISQSLSGSHYHASGHPLIGSIGRLEKRGEPEIQLGLTGILRISRTMQIALVININPVTVITFKHVVGSRVADAGSKRLRSGFQETGFRPQCSATEPQNRVLDLSYSKRYLTGDPTFDNVYRALSKLVLEFMIDCILPNFFRAPMILFLDQGSWILRVGPWIQDGGSRPRVEGPHKIMDWDPKLTNVKQGTNLESSIYQSISGLAQMDVSILAVLPDTLSGSLRACCQIHTWSVASRARDLDERCCVQ